MQKYSWSKKEAQRREARRPAPKPRTAIRRTLPTDPKQKPVNKISKKLAADLKIYAVLSKDYLRDHPKCECGRPGCHRTSAEVHHKKGRGEFLNVVQFFCAVAKVCHRWIHDNDKEAREMGLLLSRHSKQ